MFVKRIAKESLLIGAPAKINLFLEVLGKRDDGYHDLNSFFQAVSLFDRLKFTLDKTSRSATIEIKPDTSGRKRTPPDIPLPLDERNLIVRAYNLMRDRFDLAGGLSVELEKNIPVSAGLGGGSSDAAATILACSLLFDLNLKSSEMAQLGLQIGSDVPFFFSGGQALVAGRGEEIRETDFPTDYWLVLVTPNLTISTADSFKALKLGLTKKRPAFRFNGYETIQELVKQLEQTSNDFENMHRREYPQIEDIHLRLRTSDAALTRMSGSGPTVFGLYINAPEIDGDELFGRDNRQVATVRPVALPKRHP